MRVEEALYHEASGFIEYNDSGTLKNRLQQLALALMNK
jgi:hypothetical protein